jgi:hypothetical protein
MKCPTCGSDVSVQAAEAGPFWRQRKPLIWLTIIAGAALVAIVLAIAYRGHVFSGYHWIVEATGSNTAAIAVLVLAPVALVIGLLWMLLPVIIYFGFRSISLAIRRRRF